MESAHGARPIGKDGVVDRAEADEVLRTLFTDPGAARTTAEAELVPDPDPYLASIGHQVVGIVLRELGHADRALAELRIALRLARRSDDPDRWPDVMATVGMTLALDRRVSEGLRHLHRAAAALEGVPLGRVLVRRAYVTGHLQARFEESAADLREARRLFAGAGDEVWEARALNLQGARRRQARLARLGGGGVRTVRGAVGPRRPTHGGRHRTAQHGLGVLPPR